MHHALGLGARGLGRTWPNPSVGCVILQGDRVVGRGWTQAGGRPHAERMALDQAGNKARGATVYVTLEPCAHHGKTPPCADALIDVGVARVVVALRDPDPRVSGRGLAMMRDAGIEVTEAVCEAEARAAHAGFLSRVVEGLPFLTLKMAASLDGRIATSTGESRWITGVLSRRAVHAMRLGHDAVMVGAGTARADDPDLTVRDLGSSWQPVRIVVDTRAGLDPSGRLGTSAARAPLWICHGATADPAALRRWRDLGARTIQCKMSDGSVDAEAMLRTLAVEGLTRIFCEGGGEMAASLLRAGLVSELAVFGAGLVIGNEGRPAIAAMGLEHLAGAERFELLETRAIGNDVLTRWSRPRLL